MITSSNELSVKGASANNQNVKLIDMVVYKPYLNGPLCVNNVPYLLKIDVDPNKKERIRFETVTASVFQQLAVIFDYMEKHAVKEVDYQQFISVNQFNNDEKLNKQVLSDTSIQVQMNSLEFSIEDRAAVAKYVLKEWIENYYKLNLRANSTLLENKEVQESRSKLDFFHSSLEQLPELHRDILKKKYLQLEYNGRFPIDDLVYEELHISRTQYYRIKKEALYWLGLALINKR